jgi:predicted small integral membrane protein
MENKEIAKEEPKKKFNLLDILTDNIMFIFNMNGQFFILIGIIFRMSKFGNDTIDGALEVNEEKTNAMNFWFFITTLLVLLPGMVLYTIFQIYKRVRPTANPLLKHLPFMDSHFGDAIFVHLFTSILLEAPTIVEIILSVVLHLIVVINFIVGILKYGKPAEPTLKLNDGEALKLGPGSDKKTSANLVNATLNEDTSTKRDADNSDDDHDMNERDSTILLSGDKKSKGDSLMNTLDRN